jgi:(p)ppGpp synthase/HD superfamily hydrolase
MKYTKKQNELLYSAISIAVTAHYGQHDSGGRPYILHPLHLMNQLMYDADLATIAVLHDVVEDSTYELEDLRKIGFSDRTIKALDCLTHKENESYEEYIKRIGTNIDAIRVKRKDLEHNSNITRLKGVRDKDIERIKKYHKAFIYLGECRDKILFENK